MSASRPSGTYSDHRTGSAAPGWSSTQLAHQLLAGTISDGDTVRVDVNGSAAGGTGALTVTRA